MRNETTAEVVHAVINELMKRCDAIPNATTRERSPYSSEANVAEYPGGCPKEAKFIADCYREQRHLVQVVDGVIDVVEDVIVALLATKTLSLTDLTPAAQQFVRKDIFPREPLNGILLDDNDVRFP